MHLFVPDEKRAGEELRKELAAVSSCVEWIRGKMQREEEEGKRSCERFELMLR